MKNTLNFSIVGTGTMAGIYATILKQRPDTKLIAVAGNTLGRTSEFANRFDVEDYPESRYVEMFRSHPELDAVIITTPEWIREEPVAAAVGYRQHILLEKPFANSLSHVLKLRDLLSGYDRTFEICHVLRHSPRFHAMERAISCGEIGAVRHIYARRHSNNVRVQRVLGKTDLAFWLTPHDIDIMRWITGSEVKEVFARSRNNLKSVDDYLIIHLRFANGVDAVLESSWCSPPASGASRSARFEVWGTEGSIELDDAEMNVRVFREGERVSMPDTYEDYAIHGIHHGIFENLIDYFIEQVKSDRRNSSALNDGVESVRVCEMISRSVREGRVVSSDEQ